MGGFGDILKVVGALGALGATIFFGVKIYKWRVKVANEKNIIDKIQSEMANNRELQNVMKLKIKEAQSNVVKFDMLDDKGEISSTGEITADKICNDIYPGKEIFV